MMRSLFAGVSGLRNHQVRMDVIGNNIANVNTVGYKASRVTFQDVLSQTLSNAASPEGNRGGVNPRQVGLGASIGSISVNHAQGSIQMTGKSTDLALEGDGFFVLMEGDKMYYTRAGTFSMDKAGNIVNGSNGMFVAGWQADSSGEIDTNKPVGPLKVPLGETIDPRATTEIVLGGNLDANSNGDLKLSNSVITLNDGSNDYELNVSVRPTDEFNKFELVVSTDDGTLNGGSTPLTFEVHVEYDNGAEQWRVSSVSPSTSFDFKNKEGTASVTVKIDESALNGAPLFSTTTGGWTVSSSNNVEYTPATVVQTTEVYDSLGNSHTVTTTFEKRTHNTWAWESTVPGTSDTAGSPQAGSGLLTFDSSGHVDDVSVVDRLRFTPAGADTVAIDMNFTRMTKYSSENSVFLISQDGYESGVMESFNIDGWGVLTGEFSNGLTKALGQVAVASFANPAGLLRAGENAFAVSNNSGAPNIGTAGTGSRGGITPGALEMSNVDLAQEFTDMIITQRGFQANSRIITSSDEMLQELVSLKR